MITAEDEDPYGGAEVPRGHGNVYYQNGNGTKLLWVIFGTIIVVLTTIVGWWASRVDSKLSQVVVDVAVIKCQLASDCRKLLEGPNGRP